MNDTIDTAIAYFERREQTLLDEILRRQMALDEVRLFLKNARDGRTSFSRAVKRGTVAGGAATDGTGEPLLTLPDTHVTGGAHQERGE